MNTFLLIALQSNFPFLSIAKFITACATILAFVSIIGVFVNGKENNVRPALVRFLVGIILAIAWKLL